MKDSPVTHRVIRRTRQRHGLVSATIARTAWVRDRFDLPRVDGMFVQCEAYDPVRGGWMRYTEGFDVPAAAWVEVELREPLIKRLVGAFRG